MSLRNASRSLFYGGIFTVQRIVKSVDATCGDNLKSVVFNYLKYYFEKDNHSNPLLYS